MPKKNQPSVTEVALPEFMQHDWITKSMSLQTLHELFIVKARSLHIDQPVMRKDSTAPKLVYRYLETICLHQTTVADTFVVIQPPGLALNIPVVTGIYRLSKNDPITPIPVRLNWLQQSSDSNFFRVQDDYDAEGELVASEAWYQDIKMTAAPFQNRYLLLRQADGTFEKTLWYVSPSTSQFIEASPTLRHQSLEEDFKKVVQTFHSITMKLNALQNSSYQDICATRVSSREWRGRSARLQQTSLFSSQLVYLSMGCLYLVTIILMCQLPIYVMIGLAATLSLSQIVGGIFLPLEYGFDLFAAKTKQVLKKTSQAYDFIRSREPSNADYLLTLNVYDGVFSNPFKPLFKGAGKIVGYVALSPTDKLAATPHLFDVIELQRGTNTYRVQAYTQEGSFKNNNALVGPVIKTYDGKQWKTRYEDGVRKLADIGIIYLLSNMEKPLAFDIQLTAGMHFCCQIEDDLSYFVNNKSCDSIHFFAKLFQHGSLAYPFIKQICQELTLLQAQQLHHEIANIIPPQLLCLLPRAVLASSIPDDNRPCESEEQLTTVLPIANVAMHPCLIDHDNKEASSTDKNPIINEAAIFQAQQQYIEEKLRCLQVEQTKKDNLAAERLQKQRDEYSKKNNNKNARPVTVSQCPAVKPAEHHVAEPAQASEPPQSLIVRTEPLPKPPRAIVPKKVANKASASQVSAAPRPLVMVPPPRLAFLPPPIQPVIRVYAHNPYAAITADEAKRYYTQLAS